MRAGVGTALNPCAEEWESPGCNPSPFLWDKWWGHCLGWKRSGPLASAAERVGRHGSFRHCLKAGGDWRNCSAGPEGNLTKKIILVIKKKKKGNCNN